MHYLIDGHNLIGKIGDIELDDPDDEVKLILRLRSWSARRRKRKVTVIFDRGLPGGEAKGLSSGQVKVIFASGDRSADSLLISRIHNVQNPSEYTLVSSDQTILRLAEKRRLLVVNSENFAARMDREREQNMSGLTAETNDDPQLSGDEVAMWLAMFNEGQVDPKE